VVPLTTLFDDFLLANQDAGVDVKGVLGASASMAMGFAFWAPASDVPGIAGIDGMASNDPDPDADVDGGRGRGRGRGGAVGSVLASKQAGRYRVQADCPWALAFLAWQVNDFEFRVRCPSHSFCASRTFF
jgi:hypothetical protein